MPDRRSRDVALQTLLEVRDEVIAMAGDRNVRQLLTPALLQAVFEEAWRDQFDDDLAASQQGIRELVGDAFDASELGEDAP